MAHKFKAQPFEVEERVEKLVQENKDLTVELSTLKNEMAKNKFSAFVERAKEIDGGKLFISKVDNIDNEMLKTGIEYLASKLGDSVIIIANVCKDNVVMVVRVSEMLTKKGYTAGKIISDMMPKLNGRGGGRPNYAQGSGKDISKLNEVLEEAEQSILNK